jgi:4-oxalocrotonate tautomerase
MCALIDVYSKCVKEGREMPFVTIELLEGRTKEQKAALAKAVTTAVQESLGVGPERIYVFLRDLSPDNFAQGGKLRSEQPAK